MTYSFNFFPTVQSNDEIKLKEAAEYKIQAFIEMLGADAALLTDGEEIKSHDLFERLASKKTVTGEEDEEDSELKYLQVIRDIRDRQPDLFEQVKRLPKKARTARIHEAQRNSLLTYFRRGKLQKFYVVGNETPQELHFLAAAKTLAVEKEANREVLGKDFYDLLEKNKQAFKEATSEEAPDVRMKGGRDAATFVLRVLRSKEVRTCKGYTDEDELYIKDVVRLLEEGGLPRQTIKTLATALGKEANPLRILATLRMKIAPEFFRETRAESTAQPSDPREVILSEYLVGGQA